MNIPVLTSAQVNAKLQDHSYGAQKTYHAMYSTWFGGIVTDPALMMVPIDDHLVHRGDGVFEAMKVIDGNVYLLQEHLTRLASSAAQISLPLPMSLEDIKHVIMQTTHFASVQDAMLRLYVSRGPGGFTTNPYDSVASQLYLVVTSLVAVSEEKYLKGVRIGRSHVPPKEEWLARIKTCNYLTNVMMKKESVDRKLDFTIGFDQKGFLTEGSTENIVIVDRNNCLIRPSLRQILKGTTMTRSFELAEQLKRQGLIKSIEEKDLTETDLINAQEAMMIGTTLDVLPVTEYEGKVIGGGNQGPVAAELLKLIREDMRSGAKATPLID